VKIETGHELLKNVAPVNSDTVRFVADDGRTIFEVSIGKDGRSLDVRAVDNCVIGGELYAARLVVAPHASNSASVRVPRYEDEWGSGS